MIVKKVTIRVGQSGSREGARRRAGEHGIRSSVVDKEGPHLVHLADVPDNFMREQLLVRVVELRQGQ